MFPRTRGAIALWPDRCTSCLVCVRDCPNRCITIESHLAPAAPAAPVAPGGPVVPAGAGGAGGAAGGSRRRIPTRAVLDHFAIDFGLCMYCGICVEVCPYDALAWAPREVAAEVRPGELTHDRDRLARHQADVAPAQPLEAGAVAPEPGRRGRR